MAQQAQNATKSLVTVVLVLIAFFSYSQAKQTPVGLSFNGKLPNREKVSPTAFFQFDDLDSLRKEESKLGCFFASGWIRFKVIRTGKIDSLQVEGLPRIFERHFKRRVQLSEQFWTCSDNSNTGFWITMPVHLVFSAPCNLGVETSKETKPEEKLGWNAYSFHLQLFRNWSELNTLHGISIGERSFLLYPIMRINIS